MAHEYPHRSAARSLQYTDGMEQWFARLVLTFAIATSFVRGENRDANKEPCAHLIAHLIETPYESEATSMVRVLGWISEHSTESYEIFRQLREDLERNIRKSTPANIAFSNRRRAAIIDDIESEFTDAPHDLFVFVSEWLARVEFPKLSVAPSRAEVIVRIHSQISQLNAGEKEKLYRLAIDSKRIVVVGDPSDPRVMGETIRAGERKHYLEAFLQFLTFRFDQFGPSVLPFDSYPLPETAFANSVRLMQKLLAGDPSRGTFKDEQALRARFKLARLFGLRSTDETSSIVERLIVRSLEGKIVSHPRHVELLSQFRNFLVAETWELGLQRDVEREIASQSLEPSSDELQSSERQDDEPIKTLEGQALVAELEALDRTSGVPLPEERGLYSEVHPAFMPELSERSLASLEISEPLPPNTELKVRKTKSVKNDFAETGKRKLLDLREVMRAEAVALVAKMAATDWHARTVQKQLIELRKQHSEAVFERELQSICRILREIDNNGRVTDNAFGRQLKKLSHKNLYEIKPQGRSVVRLVVGLGRNGFHVLRLVPNAHQSDRETSRLFDRVAKEWAGLRQ